MAVGIGIARRARGLALVAATVALFAAALPVYAGGTFVGDLSISKADSPDPVVTGENLTYTLTVSVGPVTGIGTNMPATVTDTLPAGVTFVSAIPSQGTCGQLALVVTCSLPGIPANGSATVTIVVVAGAPGTLSNTATVSANLGDFDGIQNNNSDTEVTTVVAATPSPSPSPTPTLTLAPTLSPSPTATPAAAVLPDTARVGGGGSATAAAIAAALAIASALFLLGTGALARRRVRSD